MIEWRDRARALADQLLDEGWLTEDRWWTAFAETPRHVFAPRYIINLPEKGWQAVDIADEGGLDPVYDAGEALITQLDSDPESWETTRRDDIYYGGTATSSSSAPDVMAGMLEAIDVHPGQTILEVGTGTGYNSALLCHELGDQAVTSIDVDAGMVVRAAERLASVGYRPGWWPGTRCATRPTVNTTGSSSPWPFRRSRPGGSAG